MRKNKIIRFLIPCVLVVFMLGLVQCKQDDPEPDPVSDPVSDSVSVPLENIKIGFLVELTGTFANSSNYDAAELAVTEINNAGGIDGRNLELVLKDAYADGGDAALESVKELEAAGINLIIGPGWSSRVTKIADYTVSNDILLMPYSASAASITDIEDNGLIWRSNISDAFLTKALAEYVYNTDGATTAGIIFRDDTWGNGLAENFMEHFTSLGGEVTASLSYTVEDVDLTTIDFSDKCDQLMAAAPHILIYLSFDSDGVKFLTDLSNNSTYSESVAQQKIYSFEGNGIDLLTSNVPTEMLPNIYAIKAVSDESEGSNFSIFKDAYSSEYPASELPEYHAACSYDMTYLLAYAMLRADDISNVTDVASKLKEVSKNNAAATVINVNEFSKASTLIETGTAIDYDGASGKIEFDDNGDPSSATIEISKITDGVYVPIVVSEF